MEPKHTMTDLERAWVKALFAGDLGAQWDIEREMERDPTKWRVGVPFPVTLYIIQRPTATGPKLIPKQKPWQCSGRNTATGSARSTIRPSHQQRSKRCASAPSPCRARPDEIEILSENADRPERSNRRNRP